MVQVLNKASGLKADITYNVNVDKQGALWVTTGNGISRAEPTSPLTSYDEADGLGGAGWDIKKIQNHIYIATEVGVSALQASRY